MSAFHEFYRRTSAKGAVPGDPSDIVGLWPKEYPDSVVVNLPEAADLDDVSLGKVLRRRRSKRGWAQGGLDVSALGTLLGRAAGTTGVMSAYGYRRYPLRAFPSAGGLQSTETYVLLGSGQVEGCPCGVFHYRAWGHKLERLSNRDGGTDLYARIRRRQPWLGEIAPLLLVLTVAYQRLARKYGEAAGRLAAMEVGWLGQNLYLVGEALGLGVCAINVVDDAAVAEVLGIHPEEEGEYPMIVMGIGQWVGDETGEDADARNRGVSTEK